MSGESGWEGMGGVHPSGYRKLGATEVRLVWFATDLLEYVSLRGTKLSNDIKKKNQNLIQQEIKGNWILVMLCYHLVENLFVFSSAVYKLKN
jgi:hypothetical protein